MKRSQPPNPFELENLESRILLSGDPLVGMVDSIVPDEPDSLDTGLEIPPLEENFNSGENDSQNPIYQQSLQYDPSQNLTGLFSGLDEEDPPVDQDEDSSSDTAVTVPLSDRSITEGEKSAIILGMEELANLGRLLQDFDAFGVPLPLINDTTLGQLLGPYEVLDDRLSTPVYDYFQDAIDPPTTEGLLATLQGVTGTNDLVVTVDAVKGGYDADADEIRFDIDFQTTRKGEVYLHTGPLTEDLGFEFEEDTQSEYVAGITFDFVFGVDLEGGRNEFFLDVHELTADLDITATALNSSASLETSPVSLQVVNGTVDLDARVTVQFDETIAGDGRITLTELQSITSETIEDFVHLAPTGTLFAELPLKGDQGDSDNPTTYIYVSSGDVFAGISPDLSVKTDISTLKGHILDLLTEFKEVGENITIFEQLNSTLPVIDSSINQLLSDNLDSGFGDFLDLYTPAFEYFTLLNVFNFDVNDYLPDIGTLPGIDTPDFNINLDTHRLKLKNLLEKEYNLELDQNWDLSLYLPEIWSLFNSDFQIDEYLPKFQLLLGLPYVPRMDEVRSDMKTLLGTFPSLDGLMNYIRTTNLTDLFHDFQGGFSQDSFNLIGMYDSASTEVRIYFMADAVKEVDFTVNLESLFPDQFSELGILVDSDLEFTLTVGLNLDFSISVSAEDASLTIRQAAVTVQVKEDIDGLVITVEDFPEANRVSGGRFDFDARVELIAHGLDPPADGAITLSGFTNATNPDDLIDIQACNP
ncbi:LEPR-XLL domain-containing protein, partial [Thermodesulfobacteriota bacterium]